MPTFRPPVARPLHPIGAPPTPPGEFRVTRVFADMSFPQHGAHDGLDVGNGRVHDPILAMAPGTVTQAEYVAAAGGAAIVRIDHGEGWSSGYAHMDRIDVVKGRRVSAGDQVGILGSTGWVSGAHLHFDITRNGQRLDPWPLLQLTEDDVQYPRPMYPLALVTIAKGNNLRRSPSLSAQALLLTEDAQAGVHGVTAGEAWLDKGNEWLWIGYQREMWCVHSALVSDLRPTVTLQTLGLAGGSPDREALLAQVEALNARIGIKDAHQAQYPKG